MTERRRTLAIVADGRAPARDEIAVLVADPAWTPAATGSAVDGRRALPARELLSRVLRERDLFVETTDRLDAWADASAIADRMTHAGTSYWFGRRIGLWWWLHARLAWVAAIRAAIDETGADALLLEGALDGPVLDAAELVADALGFPVERGGAGDTRDGSDAQDAETASSESAAGRAAAPSSSPVDRVRAWLRRRDLGRRHAAIAARLETLAREPARLLVLVDPASFQRMDGAGAGGAGRHPFLGPVVAALEGTPLDPIVVELGSSVSDDEIWTRLSDARGHRTLPGDVLARWFAEPGDAEAGRREALAIAAAVEAITTPLVSDGVDLGPRLVADIARAAGRSSLPGRLRDQRRIRRLLARLRPAAVLLVNEYGQAEWLSAARSEAVPVAAVQHGIIHPWHPGYIHPRRHPAWPVPDRFYAFGRFEERLLTTASAYRPEEVRVGGSPRLAAGRPAGDRVDAGSRLRASLGVAPGDRLLVVTTNFGPPRRLYMPGAIAAVLGGDLDGVHVVLKLHPNEPEDDFYPRILAGVRAAAGRPPARLTVVKAIDLYALLEAADAHLGVFSTVLTEAVALGTPNLVAATQASSDLLGYVPAGVATAVRDGDDLRAELDRIATVGRAAATDEAARAAFLADHFEPGDASARIRADLLAWLVPDPAR